jgi:hypothetical protein
MTKRVVIGGLLAGLTMFVWLFLAHEVLGLGEMGVKEIPNEESVLRPMQAAMNESGFYIYPGFGLGPKAASAQRNEAMPAYMKKYEQSPHGVLIYNPPSGAFSFAKLLAREGALNLVEGLLVAWLLSWVAAGRGYLARAGFVAVIGVVAAISTNFEYWNWYEFPSSYITGYFITQVVGYLLIGLVAAAFVKADRAQRGEL